MSDEGEGALSALIGLQDLDTTAAQLEHRRGTVAERRRLEEVRASMAALREAITARQGERAELAGRLARLEEQSAAVSRRRKTLEDTMYGARGAAGRDLGAMDSEVHHLKVRLDALEDEELAVMEAEQPLDDELDRSSSSLEVLGQEEEALALRIAELDRDIDSELAGVVARRGELAALLPEGLMRRYEGLRARLGGVGAARLIDGRCGGCHLSLPSAEVDRIRHLPQDALATCDQCGRILVRDR
ncbi:MAG: zinc ribbon domain-containing protein [Acidimicrobiales bacterium]